MTSPDESDGRRPRRWFAVALALALAGVVLVGLALVWSPGTAPPPGPAAGSSATPAPPRSSATPGPPRSSGLTSPPVVRPAATVPPVRLAVPSIGVSSEVNSVGLNPDGTLEVPAPGRQYDQAAWFRGSPSPGLAGPSVIIGHVDSAANGPSVFYDLGRMRPGDRVVVTLADGTTRTFAVDSVQTYPKNAFPQITVYGATLGPELRLITCGGDFDRVARSYVDNTVVFARLVA